MLDRLPVEIVDLTIELAVLQLRDSDRTSVVHFAQTSKAIYAAIAPLLYHSIDILRPNPNLRDLLEHEESHELVRRVFRHTRKLTALFECVALSDRMHLFPELQEVTIGDLWPMEPMGEEHVQLRRLFIPDNTISLDNLGVLSAPLATNLPHICGIGPNPSNQFSWEELNVDAAGWMRAILNELPQLTHLGFCFYFYHGRWDDKVVVSLDVDLYRQATLAALAYPRIEVIAIHLIGSFVSRWDDFIDALTGADDGRNRVRAWKDDREETEEEREGEKERGGDQNWAVSRCRDGQSIWTEAQPVRLFAASAST